MGEVFADVAEAGSLRGYFVGMGGIMMIDWGCVVGAGCVGCRACVRGRFRSDVEWVVGRDGFSASRSATSDCA